MSTELVLLPRAQYASLLAKKCGTCSSSREEDTAETQKYAMEPTSTIPQQSVGNSLPHGFDVSAKSHLGTSSQQQHESIQERAAVGEGSFEHDKTITDSSYPGSDSQSSGTVAEAIKTVQQPSNSLPHTGESKMENSLLLKFKTNDQKYIRNILSACEKNPDIINWNSEGLISVRGEEIQGSDIVELLADTLTDRKNPVGKLIIYQALSDAGVTTKDLKNRNNKAFFNAVNGKKKLKKSSSSASKENVNSKKRKASVVDEKTEKVDSNAVQANRSDVAPEPSKKSVWISWK